MQELRYGESSGKYSLWELPHDAANKGTGTFKRRYTGIISGYFVRRSDGRGSRAVVGDNARSVPRGVSVRASQYRNALS